MKIVAILFLVFFVFNFSTCGSAQTPAPASQPQILPLKTIYQDHFLIGNIITGKYMRGDFLQLITKHFNTVTAENQMKPDHLAPRQRGGQYNWEPADNMLKLMTDNGIKVHGHTLVWHNQTPAWMFEGTAEQVRQNMVNHINTVMEHYKGKIFSWDVVNEAVLSRVTATTNLEDWRSHLRREESGWFRALGPDYIELAFRTARAADPDVKLYYNDYNLNNQRKAQVVAYMIKEINDRYRAEGNDRNLIDGVGLQGHYGTNVIMSDVRRTIERFIDLGLEVSISELDIEMRSVGSGSFGTGKDTRTSELDQRIQADVYANLFMLFKEYSDHIVRVTFWGLDDESSWKSLGNPCLWDGNLNPKQAFFAVSDPQGWLNRSRR
jgi:endo-1,4-beta-xylanase